MGFEYWPPNDISFAADQNVRTPMQVSRASSNAWRHPKQAWWHKEYVFYCSILLFKRNERKRTIVMGLSVEFGPIPTEDAFARITLLFWENLSWQPYDRSFSEIACDRAFNLLFFLLNKMSWIHTWQFVLDGWTIVISCPSLLPYDIRIISFMFNFRFLSI